MFIGSPYLTGGLAPLPLHQPPLKCSPDTFYVTPNMFNCEMLRLVREAKALSQSELAKQLGVSQPKVSRFEDGISAPNPEELTKLSEVLGQSSEFFHQAGSARSQSAVSFFRKTTSIPMKVITQFNARMNLRRLGILGELGGRKLPARRSISHRPVTTLEEAELAANELRRLWQVPRGPIENLTKLVEDTGCVVELFNFGAGKLDGLAIGGGTETPFVFLNDKFPADRRRFSLAHELAHIVMHRTVTETVEEEANVFAGAFLMPKEDIDTKLYPLTIEKLIALKLEWRCSMKAILKRALQLGRIKTRYEQFLWMRLGQLGYRTTESLENDLPQETPTSIEDRK